MPAEAGIQAREGMDTGFRRYDGTFLPIRCADHTCTYIFERERIRAQRIISHVVLIQDDHVPE